MWTKRIIKGALTFLLYLSIYTYMCIGGVGIALEFVSPMAIASMPAWHSAAVGAVSVACINGMYFFGSKLDRIQEREHRASLARAELLAAWRR